MLNDQLPRLERVARKLPPFCPLCWEVGKLTDEDVTPLWVRKILAKRLRPGAQLPPRTRVRICCNCNGFLNRKFEQTSRESVTKLILGETTSLGPREQRRVAAWIAKTSLVMAACDKKFGAALAPVIKRQARSMVRDLSVSGLPPPWCMIRVGWKIPGAHPIPSMPVARYPIPHGRLENLEIANMHANLHGLYWEFAWPLSRRSEDMRPLFDIEDNRLLRIWPMSAQSELRWLPPALITTQDAAEISQAWRRTPNDPLTSKEWLDG